MKHRKVDKKNNKEHQISNLLINELHLIGKLLNLKYTQTSHVFIYNTKKVVPKKRKHFEPSFELSKTVKRIEDAARDEYLHPELMHNEKFRLITRNLVNKTLSYVQNILPDSAGIAKIAKIDENYAYEQASQELVGKVIIKCTYKERIVISFVYLLTYNSEDNGDEPVYKRLCLIVSCQNKEMIIVQTDANQINNQVHVICNSQNLSIPNETIDTPKKTWQFLNFAAGFQMCYILRIMSIRFTLYLIQNKYFIIIQAESIIHSFELKYYFECSNLRNEEFNSCLFQVNTVNWDMEHFDVLRQLKMHIQNVETWFDETENGNDKDLQSPTTSSHSVIYVNLESTISTEDVDSDSHCSSASSTLSTTTTTSSYCSGTSALYEDTVVYNVVSAPKSDFTYNFSDYFKPVLHKGVSCTLIEDSKPRSKSSFVDFDAVLGKHINESIFERLSIERVFYRCLESAFGSTMGSFVLS